MIDQSPAAEPPDFDALLPALAEDAKRNARVFGEYQSASNLEVIALHELLDSLQRISYWVSQMQLARVVGEQAAEDAAVDAKEGS